jgi:hypothetical protein
MKKFMSFMLAVALVFVLVSCASTAKSGAESLNLWTDTAPTKSALISFVEAAVDPDSPGYIPLERRIAVFDMDGTLICETDTDYFDHTLLEYRVLQDPTYKNKASQEEIEVCLKMLEINETSSPVGGMDVPHGKGVATAFKGMTPDEFNAYVQEFKKIPMPGYEGMNHGEIFYRPMVQIVRYLQANGFTCYIVSGTDRFISRAIFYDSILSDIPNSQIIGSDVSLVATNQGDTDGLSYTFQDSDQVLLGGTFLIKNLKMNKVSAIVREIGVQPVLSFGNSTGDAAMAEYVITNNPYPSLAFMLCCDDLVRENGNESKAENMYNLCEQYGWIPVSMKNDWTTIYGDGVTRKQ